MLIDGIEYKKAIIIDYPWVDYFFDKNKTWEMRTTQAKYRGKIAIIAKGTGTIVGVAEFNDSLPRMTIKELINNFDKHRVDYIKYPELEKWCFPWVIENAKRVKPIPYDTKSKRGAVIWVNI
ncbi:ASCH domain-containing protein [Photobacterium damselae]|uniref:ASCH domain-containing protein n=1 Tax=Photobacterium damselae TaxID=38293 RepID=UPI001F1C30DB|nr:ASCH domain-containing protein [Photobacterium damselae]UKA04672.1 ASCH domain-containing protein [Photobacterium damselae subsp. damselae]